MRKQFYPALEMELGISGTLLQVHPGVHVAVVLQALRGGWSTFRSGESHGPEPSGCWARAYHEAVREDLSFPDTGEHCLTLVSAEGATVHATTVYQPARPDARVYSNSHGRLIVRGQEVLSDVTGRWCTSNFTPAARRAFLDLATCAAGDDVGELFLGSPSFGNCVERHQILRALWEGEAQKIKELRRVSSWYLDDAAHLEYCGHLLWEPDQEVMCALRDGRPSWISTDLFAEERNTRDWRAFDP